MAPNSRFRASLLTRHARRFTACELNCSLNLAGFVFTGSRFQLSRQRLSYRIQTNVHRFVAIPPYLESRLHKIWNESTTDPQNRVLCSCVTFSDPPNFVFSKQTSPWWQRENRPAPELMLQDLIPVLNYQRRRRRVRGERDETLSGVNSLSAEAAANSPEVPRITCRACRLSARLTAPTRLPHLTSVHVDLMRVPVCDGRRFFFFNFNSWSGSKIQCANPRFHKASSVFHIWEEKKKK